MNAPDRSLQDEGTGPSAALRRRTRLTAGSAAVVALALVFLLLPPLATLAYALAGDWYRSILPESWTLEHLARLAGDPRFLPALGRSLVLAVIPSLLGLAILVPLAFQARVWYPRLGRALDLLSVLPYAMPGTVAAIGLLGLYSSGPLPIAGTPAILVGAYTVAALPCLWQGIRSSLDTLDLPSLLAAARVLGAGHWDAFVKVVLPALVPGMASGFLLSFSLLFGEFVLANLLAGGQFETLQIYLYRRLSESGHGASAVVTVYLLVTMTVSLLVFRPGRKAPGERKNP